mgnify:CR=1 FL=1
MLFLFLGCFGLSFKKWTGFQYGGVKKWTGFQDLQDRGGLDRISGWQHFRIVTIVIMFILSNFLVAWLDG